MTREEAIEIIKKELRKNFTANFIAEQLEKLNEMPQDEKIAFIKRFCGIADEPSDIPMFAESAEAYKEWTGEDMGATDNSCDTFVCPMCADCPDGCPLDKEKESKRPEPSDLLTHEEAWKQIEGDLISRAELLSEIKRLESMDGNYACSFLNDAQNKSTEWYVVEDLIENAPSVSAERVGEWEKESVGTYYKTTKITCSECGFVCCLQDLLPKFNYCPNCGARMENKK